MVTEYRGLAANDLKDVFFVTFWMVPGTVQSLAGRVHPVDGQKMPSDVTRLHLFAPCECELMVKGFKGEFVSDSIPKADEATKVVDVSNSNSDRVTFVKPGEMPGLTLLEAEITDRVSVKCGSLEIVTKGATMASGLEIRLDGKEIKAVRSLKLAGAVREAWRCVVEFFPDLSGAKK